MGLMNRVVEYQSDRRRQKCNVFVVSSIPLFLWLSEIKGKSYFSVLQTPVL